MDHDPSSVGRDRRPSLPVPPPAAGRDAFGLAEPIRAKHGGWPVGVATAVAALVAIGALGIVLMRGHASGTPAQHPSPADGAAGGRAADPALELAFVRGQTHTYLGERRVGSVDAAVVRSRSSVPMDFTLRLSALTSLMHLPAGQLPSGASVSYNGSMSERATSWIDRAARQLLRTKGSATFAISMSAHGLPTGQIPAGGLQMTASMSMTLQRI